LHFESEIKQNPAINTRELTNLLFVTYNSAASGFPNMLTAMFIYLILSVTTATAE